MDFSSFPYAKLKNIFNDAINSMFTGGLAVTCRLYYPITKYETCSNCTPSPIGGKSNSIYNHGGPVPFSSMQNCPLCNGENKKPVVSTEDVELLVVHDPKQFINASVNIPDGTIQVIAKNTLTSKLENAESLVASLEMNGYKEFRYRKVTSPVPAGFADEKFVFCNWERE